MTVKVEVVYALPDHQQAVILELPVDATVEDALAKAAADPGFSGIDFSAHAVGVFGEVCAGDRRLVDGDRVEVYRELRVDAKTARRLRAEEQARRRDL